MPEGDLSPAEIEELEYATANRAFLRSLRKAQRSEDDEEELP